jgi:predicted transcriptional regulator
MAEDTNTDLVELATELTIAWLQNPNNRVAAEEVPAFLRNMHATVTELTAGTGAAADAEQADAAEPEHVPAVSAANRWHRRITSSR